jgi:Flp pilus assembly protein TadD
LIDPELYRTWLAIDEAECHDENLRMLEHWIEARPNDADLHLLIARTLCAMNRDEDSLSAVNRAIDCGEDDPAILTQAASRCFFAGDLKTARKCVDRATRVAPRDFPLKKDLKDLARNLSRRERERETEVQLQKAWRANCADGEVARSWARHLERTGRTFAAYHVLARGLHHNPDDRRLHRLERRLRSAIPDRVRAEAHEWAESGSPP